MHLLLFQISVLCNCYCFKSLFYAFVIVSNLFSTYLLLFQIPCLFQLINKYSYLEEYGKVQKHSKFFNLKVFFRFPLALNVVSNDFSGL